MRFHAIPAAVAVLSLGTAWLAAPATARDGVSTPTCAGRAATVVGTPGRDSLDGTPGADVTGSAASAGTT
jgi:hypothetical protein